jgi:putative transposase
VRKSFVFKRYPTRQQAAALTETLETHRQLYNRALGERKAASATRQRSRSFGDQSAGLKAQRAANPYVARANFSACQRTLKRLDRTFAAFFRRLQAGDTPGYPRFKSLHRFRTVDYIHRDGCRPARRPQDAARAHPHLSLRLHR